MQLFQVTNNKYMIFASPFQPAAVDIILINRGDEDISQ